MAPLTLNPKLWSFALSQWRSATTALLHYLIPFQGPSATTQFHLPLTTRSPWRRSSMPLGLIEACFCVSPTMLEGGQKLEFRARPSRARLKFCQPWELLRLNLDSLRSEAARWQVKEAVKIASREKMSMISFRLLWLGCVRVGHQLRETATNRNGRLVGTKFRFSWKEAIVDLQETEAAVGKIGGAGQGGWVSKSIGGPNSLGFQNPDLWPVGVPTSNPFRG